MYVYTCSYGLIFVCMFVQFYSFSGSLQLMFSFLLGGRRMMKGNDAKQMISECWWWKRNYSISSSLKYLDSPDDVY